VPEEAVIPSRTSDTGEAEILGACELPTAGLYRSHESQNIGAVASHMIAGYRGDGLIRLGSRRSLAVIAVDGLGFHVAQAGLAPDVLTPLTTVFPSTTTAALMSSVTRRTPSEHGFIGVQYLHSDGRRGYNCITGEVTEPSSTGAVGASGVGASGEPAFSTAFMALRELGVPSFSLPGELASLPAAWLGRLLDGSHVLDSRDLNGAPSGARAVREIVEVFTRDLTDAVGRHPGSLVWAYLNLDDHLHQRGPDRDIEWACGTLDSLARGLGRAGTAVLLYADHGCVASRPSDDTISSWREVAASQACRLPPGGAGRVRWLYPHAGLERQLADRVRSRFPATVVISRAELSRWGLVEEGSIGQARLGEVVMLASGPDFPVPDPAMAYEHGSLTAQEMLVPLAVWQPVQ
jgi:Type I phosphodiesterase / nucleotide pyrophosphatase